MKTLTQKYIGDDGKPESVFEVTHIFAESGYLRQKFGRKRRNCGWHVQLGTNDSPDNYVEVPGEQANDVPETLEDVEYHVLTEQELAEATKEPPRSIWDILQESEEEFE